LKKKMDWDKYLNWYLKDSDRSRRGDSRQHLLQLAPPEGAFTHFHSAELDDGTMAAQEKPGAAGEKSTLDEAAYAQLTAKEDKKKDGEKDKGGEKDKKGSKEKGAGEGESEKPKLAEPVAMDFDHIEDRIARLSFNSADIAGDALSPDGETLYFLAKYDKGYDLWKYTQRKKDIKLVADFGAREAGLDDDAVRSRRASDVHRRSYGDLAHEWKSIAYRWRGRLRILRQRRILRSLHRKVYCCREHDSCPGQAHGDPTP
jgi:hypothetical protein